MSRGQMATRVTAMKTKVCMKVAKLDVGAMTAGKPPAGIYPDLLLQQKFSLDDTRPENFAANTPGMKVVCPATPADAKGLIKSSIRDNDPVCFMENTILYNLKDEVPEDNEFLVPLGKANVIVEGNDISIIAHGKAVHTALEVAEELADKHNISAEVLDLRSIRPLDEEAIIKSVKKTNRVVLAEENKPFCGVDAQICFLIQDKAFDYLDAPIGRVSAVDAPQAYSKALESIQLPGKEKVLRAALNIL